MKFKFAVSDNPLRYTGSKPSMLPPPRRAPCWWRRGVGCSPFSAEPPCSVHFTSFPCTNEWAYASRGRLSLSSSVSLLLLPPNLQLFWPYFVSLILVLPSFPNSIIIWWPSDLYSSISQDRSLEKGKYLIFKFFCALVQELGCFQRLVNSYFPILDGNQAREMVHWSSTLVALGGSRFDSSPQAPV